MACLGQTNPVRLFLNQSRSRLLYCSRSGEATASTTAPLPRLASGKASTLLASLAFACLREGLESFSLGPKASLSQSERSDPTEILQRS